tara:strand:- start:288 stop:1361 length:1074 start_codon:yes stop_codon:yes gene_type:complete
MDRDSAIIKTDNFSIRHEGEIHNGKVRSVYWLNQKDSSRIEEQFGVINSQLGVMLVSDRISAFDCIWEGETLKGVPGKGASLNAISEYWFKRFEEESLAGNHILATPHPLVWIVEKAEPVMIEAIARQYITGSMWRAYERGKREFCGIQLPEGLKRNQRLDELLVTPSTKGIMKGIPGIREKDDENITRDQIINNYRAFGFRSIEDVDLYEKLLLEGFDLISKELNGLGKIFVDTKFELGYDGKGSMIYIDENGTPDSSRYWDSKLYEQGEAEEKSKERFREILLNGVPDKDVLLNKDRMAERIALAQNYRVSDEDMMKVSELYQGLSKQITGEEVPIIGNAREEIMDSLMPFGIIK